MDDPAIPPPLPPPAVSLKAELGDWIGCLWSAATCWFMAGLFFVAWWWPLELDDGSWIKLGVGVLVLEFIAVHSGAFLASFFSTRFSASRLVPLLGLLALYSVFGVAIALAFRSWWLLWSFVALMLGRLYGGIVGQDDMSRALTQRRVIASVGLYLLLTFATVGIPVPRGGVTETLRREKWAGGGSGLWVDHPERALAMGFIYFLVLGLIEARPPKQYRPGAFRGTRPE